jgi:Domain of unknown function (DUF4304)
MDARSQFHAQVRKILTPALSAEGFHASGTTYRRALGEMLHVITLQGSVHGGQCCVCLGIHLAFLPTVGSSGIPDAEKIEEPECEFRTRLTPIGQADSWWTYGQTEREAAASAESILSLYRAVGAPYFARFSHFPVDFARVTPEMLASDSELPFPPEGTFVRRALALSRIALHIGRAADARAFAEIGLSRVGPAVSLKRAFRDLIESANKTLQATAAPHRN